MDELKTVSVEELDGLVARIGVLEADQARLCSWILRLLARIRVGELEADLKADLKADLERLWNWNLRQDERLEALDGIHNPVEAPRGNPQRERMESEG